MIIFGTRGTNATITGINEETSCPNCGSHKTLLVGYTRSYFHIFWIPTFPLAKSYFTVCSNCKALYKQNELAIPTHYKLKTKPPVWTFIGLILLTAFISFLIFDIKRDESNNRKDILSKIESPYADQIYELKLDRKEYSLIKLTRIAGDTIFFVPHQYMVDKRTGLSKLNLNDFSSEEDEDYSYYWLKDSLITKMEDGTILKIRD